MSINLNGIFFFFLFYIKIAIIIIKMKAYLFHENVP